MDSSKYFTTAMGPKLIKLEFMQLSEMGGKWECLQWSSVQTHIIPPSSMSWEEEKSRLFFQKQNGKSKILNLTADILRNWCHKCSLDCFSETCNVKKRNCRSEECYKLTSQHDGAALSQWRKMGKAFGFWWHLRFKNSAVAAISLDQIGASRLSRQRWRSECCAQWR